MPGYDKYDPYDLKRFLEAQKNVIEDVKAELRRGRKETHWMWFVFPQLKGLGNSEMAQKYGITSRAEAKAYMAYPALGRRLVECTQLVNSFAGKSAEQIFGGVDAMKFRSSMTLFAEVTEDDSVFAEALKKYFDGHGDPVTLARL
jgi:uncharacterized protein (DUF1810 family)